MLNSGGVIRALELISYIMNRKTWIKYALTYTIFLNKVSNNAAHACFVPHRHKAQPWSPEMCKFVKAEGKFSPRKELKLLYS